MTHQRSPQQHFSTHTNKLQLTYTFHLPIQVSTKFRSLPIQVSMPSSHHRGTVSRTKHHMLGPPQASRAPDVLVLKGLRFLHSHEKNRSHNNVASGNSSPKNDGPDHPGHLVLPLLTRSQKDTLRRTHIDVSRPPLLDNVCCSCTQGAAQADEEKIRQECALPAHHHL